MRPFLGFRCCLVFYLSICVTGTFAAGTFATCAFATCAFAAGTFTACTFTAGCWLDILYELKAFERDILSVFEVDSYCVTCDIQLAYGLGKCKMSGSV